MSRGRLLLALLASLAFSPAAGQRKQKEHYTGMKTFVTRPDIECASWKVTVHDERRVAPGYWFVSPYEKNGNREPGGSWIGPHIYDNGGELVWSGSDIFNHINVMDFGVMNVAGKEELSMSYAVEGSGYILDHQYNVQQTVEEGKTGSTFNMHDFRTVENGTKWLYLKRYPKQASARMAKQDLGYDGRCAVMFPAFEERDVATGKVLYKWSAEGIIPLSDSTMAFAPVKERCTGGYWDFLHSNAIDKFADGNYLLSTRHSDTIYKISKDDGSIIWRLHGQGGKMSDFQMNNLNFSRQHHARIREQNETHTIISLLDNAMGADAQPATTPWSRGLLVALREDEMTAEVIFSIDHPHQGHAFRRGSYHVLDNGNVFMGWSEQGLHSEHTPDGKIVLEAEFVERKLGTYRSFKFPFVGDPQNPPDIYSNVSSNANITSTNIWVSWNGATEVASWTLFKTNKAGDRSQQLKSVPRAGFETKIEHDGYAKFIYIEAKDSSGEALGKSKTFETDLSRGTSKAAIADETLWLEGNKEENKEENTPDQDQTSDQPPQDGEDGGPKDESSLDQEPSALTTDILGIEIATFIAGIACGMAIVLVFTVVKRRLPWFQSKRGPKYTPVTTDDVAEYDQTTLDDLPRGR